MIDEDQARMGMVTSWFNEDGGYGFILPEKGGKKVFVRHTCIAPRTKVWSLKKSARASYEVTQKKVAGLWTKNVCATG